MERIFQALAAFLAVAAGYFLWADNRDALFVSAVLGAVAFFLSIRFQVKERNRRRAVESDAAEGHPGTIED
jgi:hypothetical protein